MSGLLDNVNVYGHVKNNYNQEITGENFIVFEKYCPRNIEKSNSKAAGFARSSTTN